jgi:hypothetical protein
MRLHELVAATHGDRLRGGERLMARSLFQQRAAERRAYLRFLDRIITVHATSDDEKMCMKCVEPAPCDTMRAVWIFDRETYRVGGDA